MKMAADIFENRATPAGTVALEVLASLRNIWVELWKLGSEEDFFIQLIEPMSKDPALSGVEELLSSDDLAEAPKVEVANEQRTELENELAWDNGPMPSHAKAGSIEYSVFETACEFCVKAIRVQTSLAPVDDKWRLASEAKNFLGILQGYISGVDEPGKLSALAKRGAYVRHAEDRALKVDVFDWCHANFAKFKTIDAAAYEVVKKQVPVTFRTAQRWISEWKKLQSAGRL